MKRIIIFLAIFIIASSLTVLALPEPSVNAIFNVEDFHVEISANGLTPYSRVTLAAVPDESSVEAVFAGNSSVYTEQLEVGADGKINKRVKFSSDAQGTKYKIYLISESSTYISNEFQHLVDTLVTPAKNAINTASASSMYSALSGSDTSLGLDMTEYNSLSEDNKKKTAAILHSLRPQGGFEEIADIHKAFAQAVCTVSVPLSQTPSDVFSKYSDELAIDISLLNNLTDAENKAFNDFVKTKSYSTPTILTQGYEEAVFVAKARCAQTAGELQNLFLNTYSAKLNLNKTNYSKLISPISVFSSLHKSKQEIAGFADAKSKFESISLSAYENQENNDGNKGSFGAASGGGMPATVPVEQMPSQIPPSQEQSVYTDLEGFSWAEKSIANLTRKGIVSGDGNGRFRPADKVTRAEFVKMLVAAFDIKAEHSSDIFEDVKSSMWYSEYISAAVSTGIVKGVTDSTFAPDAPVKRQDIAVMAVRALNTGNVKLQNIRYQSVSDADMVSDYAKSSVDKLYKSGIINGYEDGSFAPHESATRAEVAKIIETLLSAKGAVN